MPSEVILLSMPSEAASPLIQLLHLYKENLTESFYSLETYKVEEGVEHIPLLTQVRFRVLRFPVFHVLPMIQGGFVVFLV